MVKKQSVWHWHGKALGCTVRFVTLSAPSVGRVDERDVRACVSTSRKSSSRRENGHHVRASSEAPFNNYPAAAPGRSRLSSASATPRPRLAADLTQRPVECNSCGSCVEPLNTRHERSRCRAMRARCARHAGREPHRPRPIVRVSIARRTEKGDTTDPVQYSKVSSVGNRTS